MADKIIDLTPSFPLTSKEEEIIVAPVTALSDLVGDQSLNTPAVIQQNHIRSANFISGQVGWSIEADGTAEFQNVNIGHQRISVSPGDNIQDAIDAVDAAGGGVVFLKSGTHTISSNITGKSKVSIIGEGLDITILDFNNNNAGLLITGTSGTSFSNFSLESFTVQNSDATYAIDLDFCENVNISNISVSNNTNGGFRAVDSNDLFVISSLFNNNGANGFFFSDSASGVNNFVSLINCRSNNNGANGFEVDDGAGESLIEGHFLHCRAENNGADGFEVIDGSIIACTALNNTVIGIFTSGFVCNSFSSINGTNWDTEAAVGIVGSNSDPVNTTKQGLLINGSGGSLTTGDVVILKSSAAGNEVTTTTTQGDDKIMGICFGSSSDGGTQSVQMEGKATFLKVDGTINIAVGDFIGTFTTAKIAMKAAAGDMAFAIALEAYTTNDSNGVIDALIITPRKI